jgi:mono/diheme cytochrome c family protein
MARGLHQSRSLLLMAAAVFSAFAGGCYRHSDMAEQPKFWKVYRPTDFFADGQSARPLPTGVVPIEELRTDREYYFAKDSSGKLIDHLPATYPDGRPYPDRGPAMAALLERGQQRYNIYCIVCHGQLGYGDGMIVQRGFPAPPSLHSDKVRLHEPLGHYYDVITNGYGAMFGYAERVTPDDRWAITAYVKALQLSQNPTQDQLDRAKAAYPETPVPASAVPEPSAPAAGGEK